MLGIFTKLKDKISDLVDDGKTYTAEIAIKKYINHFLSNECVNGKEPLGKVIKVLKFELDPKTKTASLSVELAGEDKPVDFTAIKYNQITDEELEIVSLDCSKEWLSVVANTMLPKKIELPAVAGKIFKVLT